MNNFSNFSRSELAVGIDDAALSLSVPSGHGTRFPAAPFTITVWNKTDFPVPSDAYRAGEAEIILVTNKTGDVFTIERAQESTVAVTHNTPGKSYGVVNAETAAHLNAPLADIQDGQIVFSDNGVFGGSPDFLFNPTAITPSAPVSVTPQGTPGVETWSYAQVEVNSVGQSVASSPVTTATGAAELNDVDFNRIVLGSVQPGNTIDLYITECPVDAVIGLIATGLTGDSTYDDMIGIGNGADVSLLTDSSKGIFVDGAVRGDSVFQFSEDLISHPLLGGFNRVVKGFGASLGTLTTDLGGNRDLVWQSIALGPSFTLEYIEPVSDGPLSVVLLGAQIIVTLEKTSGVITTTANDLMADEGLGDWISLAPGSDGTGVLIAMSETPFVGVNGIIFNEFGGLQLTGKGWNYDDDQHVGFGTLIIDSRGGFNIVFGAAGSGAAIGLGVMSNGGLAISLGINAGGDDRGFSFESLDGDTVASLVIANSGIGPSPRAVGFDKSNQIIIIGDTGVPLMAPNLVTANQVAPTGKFNVMADANGKLYVSSTAN